MFATIGFGNAADAMTEEGTPSLGAVGRGSTLSREQAI